jgi:hypothetical protein
VALARPEFSRREIRNDETITQFGIKHKTKPWFHSGPNAEGDTYQSVSAGRFTPFEMRQKVIGETKVDKRDQVRYTTAARLRAEGFIVVHEPTDQDQDHTAVALPEYHIPWDTEVRARFEKCFGEDNDL